MIKELLPIGSIVLLRNAKKRIMIYGIKQGNDKDEKEYDYIGVVYPEGNLSKEYQFLFNHEDIVKVFFRGYEDIERQEFIKRLVKYYGEEENGEIL